ncbi:MAG: hypothetical protein ABR569_04805 [Gaiellaceae bacterium]
MRTYDFHRGLMTALGAGVAGLLVWLAVRTGQQTTGRFWASMGIIAGAGLVMAFAQLLGGWTKWGWPRLSGGVFLLGFLPVLVCTGWVILATQPGHGWNEGRLVSWSHDLGIYGFVHSLGLYHGVLAFGFGLVLGFSFDTTGPRRRDEVVVDRTRPVAAPGERPAADEPASAEQTEVADAAPTGEVTREQDGTLVGARRVEIREGGERTVPAQDPEQLS